VKKSFAYPRIKGLAIADRQNSLGAISKDAIIELAKYQHTLGVPIEFVSFWAREPPVDVMERLQPWVGAVHCHQEGAVDG
jgi:hypothetical protein